MDWNDLVKSAFNYATEITTKYGPIAWDTMLWVKRIEGMQYALYGFISLGIIYAIFKVRAKVAPLFYEGEVDKGEIQFINLLSYLPAAVASAIPFIFVCDLLLDVWVWVAIFKPELAIAHDLFLKASK